MKAKVFSLILFFTLVSVATAKEPYFVTSGNQTLYYERYKAGTTKLVQTTTLEIGEVEQDGSCTLVNYTITLRKANGQPMFGGAAPMTARIEKNGDTWTDLGGAVKGMLKNMFPTTKLKGSGDAAIMPANLHPGDSLPEAHCCVMAGIAKLTIDVTERSVLREETITTPAGTFKCMVARQHKVENAPLHHADNWSDSWYAPGVGYVRHDTYDKKMVLLTSEILISKE